jgi:hypothetical protein
VGHTLIIPQRKEFVKMLREIFLIIAAISLIFAPNKGLLGYISLGFLGIAMLIDGLKMLKKYK